MKGHGELQGHGRSLFLVTIVDCFVPLFPAKHSVRW